MTIEGKTINLFPASEPGAPLVVLNADAGEGDAVLEALREYTDKPLSLAVIGGLRWEDDLTPWPNPPIFRGSEPCAGRADDYLELLTGRMLPAIRAQLQGMPDTIVLAGYSLAGLFALYAAYRTDAFQRIVCASGSLWYPGFADYAVAHAFVRHPDRLYLSLGDREHRTKNPIMRGIEDQTRRLADHYRAQGIMSILEMNPGGHFDDPGRRLAKGIAWALEGALE